MINISWKNVYEPIRRSGIQITIEKKKNLKKYLNWKKIDKHWISLLRSILTRKKFLITL